HRKVPRAERRRNEGGTSEERKSVVEGQSAGGSGLGVRGVRRGSRILPSPQRHGGHGGAQRLILGALSQGAGSRHSHAVGQMRKEGTGAFGAGVTLFT